MIPPIFVICPTFRQVKQNVKNLKSQQTLSIRPKSVGISFALPNWKTWCFNNRGNGKYMGNVEGFNQNAVKEFEIGTEELKLFDCSFMEIEQFFLDYQKPLNIYLQYLYGWMLAQRSKPQMLEKFLESVYQSDVSKLLKCNLSLISQKYSGLSASLWKDLESEFFLNPILQAEQLNLLGVYFQGNKDYAKAINYYAKAQELFDNFGLKRRALRCECSICDLNLIINPSFDAKAAWADIVFEAKKIGDRSIYMSALSKLSFSL